MKIIQKTNMVVCYQNNWYKFKDGYNKGDFIGHSFDTNTQHSKSIFILSKSPSFYEPIVGWKIKKLHENS